MQAQWLSHKLRLGTVADMASAAAALAANSQAYTVGMGVGESPLELYPLSPGERARLFWPKLMSKDGSAFSRPWELHPMLT